MKDPFVSRPDGRSVARRPDAVRRPSGSGRTDQARARIAITAIGTTHAIAEALTMDAREGNSGGSTAPARTRRRLGRTRTPGTATARTMMNSRRTRRASHHRATIRAARAGGAMSMKPGPPPPGLSPDAVAPIRKASWKTTRTPTTMTEASDAAPAARRMAGPTWRRGQCPGSGSGSAASGDCADGNTRMTTPSVSPSDDARSPRATVMSSRAPRSEPAPPPKSLLPNHLHHVRKCRFFRCVRAFPTDGRFRSGRPAHGPNRLGGRGPSGRDVRFDRRPTSPWVRRPASRRATRWARGPSDPTIRPHTTEGRIRRAAGCGPRPMRPRATTESGLQGPQARRRSTPAASTPAPPSQTAPGRGMTTKS